jgi:hypothetical protein
MAEAFVKTFKRDYVRVSAIPNAAAALALIDTWMDDYNTVHPHSRLGYHSPLGIHSVSTRRVSGLTGSTPLVNRPSRATTCVRPSVSARNSAKC